MNDNNENTTSMATHYTLHMCYNRRRDPPPMQCTYSQLKDMCLLMSRSLPGCTFIPEHCFEGGIQFTHWPGKEENETSYKTFRFMHTKDYPWINDSTPDNHIFYVPRDNWNFFFVKLKAFGAAPAFTDAELTAFRTAFQEIIKPSDGWIFFTPVTAKEVNK